MKGLSILEKPLEKIELDKIWKTLSPAPYNSNKVSDERREILRKSLMEFGWARSVTANKHNMRLVGGHHCIDEALKIFAATDVPRETKEKLWLVPVEWIDIQDEAREIALSIRLNQRSGEDDFSILRDNIEMINTGDLDLEITGFSKKEVEEMMAWTPDLDEENQNVDEKNLSENLLFKVIVKPEKAAEFKALLARNQKLHERYTVENRESVVLQS